MSRGCDPGCAVRRAAHARRHRTHRLHRSSLPTGLANAQAVEADPPPHLMGLAVQSSRCRARAINSRARQCEMTATARSCDRTTLQRHCLGHQYPSPRVSKWWRCSTVPVHARCACGGLWCATCCAIVSPMRQRCNVWPCEVRQWCGPGAVRQPGKNTARQLNAGAKEFNNFSGKSACFRQFNPVRQHHRFAYQVQN